MASKQMTSFGYQTSADTIEATLRVMARLLHDQRPEVSPDIDLDDLTRIGWKILSYERDGITDGADTLSDFLSNVRLGVDSYRLEFGPGLMTFHASGGRLFTNAYFAHGEQSAVERMAAPFITEKVRLGKPSNFEAAPADAEAGTSRKPHRNWRALSRRARGLIVSGIGLITVGVLTVAATNLLGLTGN